jgi:hypothetical protein
MDGGLSVAPETGESAMKKLCAYAAIALLGAGALMIATHSDAKSGGFAGGFKGHWAFAKPHFAPPLHAVPPHHSASAPSFAHRHRFARGFGFGFPDADFDAPYAEPQIIEVPQETDDAVPASTDPRRVSVWRGNSTACSAEYVTVPSSQGGDTTVRIIRC